MMPTPRRVPGWASPLKDLHKINDHLGLNRNLEFAGRMYDEGDLAIVQGVGYPNPNRSHFVSTSVWETADPRAKSNTGWLGRYFDNDCGGMDPTVGISLKKTQPEAFGALQNPGICLDSPEVYRWIHGGGEAAMAEELFEQLNQPGSEATGSSIEEVGKPGGKVGEDSLAFLERVALDAQVSSEKILEVASKHKSKVQYAGTPISRSLNLVSRMIAGGLPTRVYYVSHGGFDTHQGQEGRHDNLLGQLDAALKSFFTDLKEQGNDERVTLMTFSEFGRRVAENASAGTDHGKASCLFVAGSAGEGRPLRQAPEPHRPPPGRPAAHRGLPQRLRHGDRQVAEGQYAAGGPRGVRNAGIHGLKPVPSRSGTVAPFRWFGRGELLERTGAGCALVPATGATQSFRDVGDRSSAAACKAALHIGREGNWCLRTTEAIRLMAGAMTNAILPLFVGLLFLAVPARADEPPGGQLPGPFGIGSCHINGRSVGDFERWVPQMAAINLRFQRSIASGWGAVEPEQGRWDWRTVDDQVRYLDGLGMKCGALLIGNPGWNTADPPGSLPVNNLSGWSEYVSRTVTHLGPKVRFFEVWNEPPNFTGPDQTPADYAKIVVSAYDAAKAADPHCLVGLAAKSVHVNYLEQVIRAGAKDHFDWITLHPYEVLDGIVDQAGLEPVFMHIVPTVRKMLGAVNPAKRDVPIFFTELGCDAGRHGAEAQAHAVVKAYTMGIAQGVSCIQWFEGRDGDSGPMGLLDGEGKPRPAYHALGRMIGLLGQRPAYLGWVMPGDRSYGFVFEGAGGPALVAWTPRGETDRVRFSREVGILDPLTGRTTRASAHDLTAAPVFIRGVPADLVAQARRNRNRLLPWGGDFSKARTVSITMGADGGEKGLHTRASRRGGQGGGRLRRTGAGRQCAGRQHVHRRSGLPVLRPGTDRDHGRGAPQRGERQRRLQAGLRVPRGVQDRRDLVSRSRTTSNGTPCAGGSTTPAS